MTSRAEPRRRPALAAGLLLAALGLLVAAACAPPPPERPDSLLLVTLDTLRADHVGVYAPDSPARTPNLDAFAAEGLKVERAWSPVPLTTPAHASILTGLYPPGHGVRNNARFRLPDEVTTIAELLRGEGYQTAAFLAAFTTAGMFGLAQGFELYDDDLGYSASGSRRTQRPGDEVIADAIEWLREGRDARRPYFLWVHLFDPHTPYAPPPPFAQEYAGNPYAGDVAFTDALVGELLGALDEQGLSERTIVAILSDHGEGLGTHGEEEHGLLIYEESLHVPFLVRAPKLIEPGRVDEGPASVVDFVPTALSLLELTTPEGLHGRDLLDPNAAPPAPWAETLYPFEEFGWSALYATREGDLKYIASSEPELYDLAADPREGSNVIAERPEDAARLDELLRRRASEIVDEELLAAAAGFGGATDPETIARLESLGYVAGGASAGRGEDQELSALPALEGRSPREAIGDYELFDRAQDFMRAGQHDTAADMLGRLVERDETNPQFQLKRAQALEFSERYEEAEEAYKALIEAHPTFYLGYRSYSSFLEERGRPIDSRNLWIRLDGLLPGFVGVETRMARAETKAGLPEQAIERMDAYLAERPDDVQGFIELGRARKALGESEAALESYRRALALKPATREAAEAALALLEEQGREGEARRLVEELAARAPRDPFIASLVGRYAE